MTCGGSKVVELIFTLFNQYFVLILIFCSPHLQIIFFHSQDFFVKRFISKAIIEEFFTPTSVE